MYHFTNDVRSFNFIGNGAIMKHIHTDHSWILDVKVV